jgi:hypothetical protein
MAVQAWSRAKFIQLIGAVERRLVDLGGVLHAKRVVAVRDTGDSKPLRVVLAPDEETRGLGVQWRWPRSRGYFQSPGSQGPFSSRLPVVVRVSDALLLFGLSRERLCVLPGSVLLGQVVLLGFDLRA